MPDFLPFDPKVDRAFPSNRLTDQPLPLPKRKELKNRRCLFVEEDQMRFRFASLSVRNG
jgi:hypothetical protein